MVPGPGNPGLEQGRRPEGNEAVDLGGEPVEVPPRERQDAAGGEAVEEGPPGLDRVEGVLGEDIGPCRAGGEGVDERDLDDVEATVEPRDVAPRLVVDESHRRAAVEVSGVGAEGAVDRIEDRFVDLDGDHLALTERQCREHVTPAAGAHHQHLGVAPEIVGQVGDVVTGRSG